MRERPRPTAGAILATATAAALLLGSRTTGTSWLLLMGCGVAGALVVSAIWALVALRRTVLVIVASPADAVVGRPVTITVGTADGRSRPVGVRPVSHPADRRLPADVRALAGLRPPQAAGLLDEGRAELPLTASRRGVEERVGVEVSCGAPLGLLWWRRIDVLPLPRPLDVAPVIPWSHVTRFVLPAGEGEAPPTRRDGDAVRSVREHRPEDPLRAVHWPATARAGTLMVREMEAAVPAEQVVRLLIATDGSEEGERRLAEEACARAAAALRDGKHVEVLTLERGGTRLAPVLSERDLARRAARVVRGRPAPPPGWEPARVLTNDRR